MLRQNDDKWWHKKIIFGDFRAPKKRYIVLSVLKVLSLNMILSVLSKMNNGRTTTKHRY